MQRFYSRWGVALIMLVAFVTITPAASPNQEPTDPNGGYGEYDRPCYLLICLEDDFRFSDVDKVTGKIINQAEDTGSRMLVLQIGVYHAGFDIFDTRYEGTAPENVDLDAIPLFDPITGEPLPTESLNLNQATVVGGFRTLGDMSTHMVTPVPDPILQTVQDAVFNALPFLNELVENSINGIYPTTSEIAVFVYEHQGEAGASFNDIQESMYASNMRLNCTTCRAEGALFPHKPNSNKLFNFDLELPIDDGEPNQGKLTVTISFDIQIDIKGGTDEAPFNLGSNGTLPVRIPATDHFDPIAEVNIDSVYIRGVPVCKYTYADDGALILHFDTQQLVAAGVDEYTTYLTLNGMENFYDQPFVGSDTVKIVPPNK